MDTAAITSSDVRCQGGGWQVGSNFGSCRSIKFSPSGQRFAWSGVQESLNAADRAKREHLIRFKDASETHYGWPEDECWRVLGFVSEDGIAYESSGGLRIWSIEKREVVANLRAADPEGYEAALSPRGTLWLTYRKVEPMRPGWRSWTGELGQAWILRVPSGERVGEAWIDDEASVAFSPDDELIAIVGVASVKVQEVKSGRLIASLELPRAERRNYQGPHVVEFSPTRDQLAVARGRTLFLLSFTRP